MRSVLFTAITLALASPALTQGRGEPRRGEQPAEVEHRAQQGGLGFLAGAVGSKNPSKRAPNVVFIMADDLGYGELGSFGQQKIRTPRLDRLAAQGMRLTRHYAGSPVCAPSRCVLLTGRHPGHAAVRDNKEHKPEGQWALPTSEPMLSEMMRDAGYTTGAFGKWGLGPPKSDADALARGFRRFVGYNCQRHAHSYYPEYLWFDRERIALANAPAVPGHGKLKKGEDPNDPASYARFKGTDYAPNVILTAAKQFVRDNQEQPFFLYYPTVIPHLALHVPDAELAQYEGEFEETPYPGGHGYTPHRTPRAAYAAMITHLDTAVGELLDLLDELGLDDDTIVVFTSDNGATHSPVGGTDVDFFNSCGGLRGRKGSMYEGGIRVPAIVRWPGVVAPGSQSDRITGFEDWMPTLAELCHGELPAGSDGISFAATLRGEQQRERPFLYREFAGYRGWQAVWVGEHKLVRSNLQRKGKLELFDLDADPHERNDLSANEEQLVTELLDIAHREHTKSETFPIKWLDVR